MLKREEIQAAIERAKEAELKVVEDKAAHHQKDVLDGLWRSANEYGPGTSHSARISAWRALGDALGVFRSPSTPMASLTAIEINIVGSDGSRRQIQVGRGMKEIEERKDGISCDC